MKLAVCQLPDKLSAEDAAWRLTVDQTRELRADLLVLNEMPIWPWLAAQPQFDEALSALSVSQHERFLSTLTALPFATLGSRPVPAGDRLANEAFLADDRGVRPFHQKHYFPQESGYWEESWFRTEKEGFDLIEFQGVRIGAMLCTEIMFTEWARHYRRQGAHVIAVPRASATSMRTWHAAAAMAAVVSGCYVISSNRCADLSDPTSSFGGRGFIFSPIGELVGETSEQQAILTVDIDLEIVREAQSQYPCYVQELV